MAKSSNLYAHIEPEIKEQAESILSDLGISASSAINMFYKQIILQRGIPFDVKIPQSASLNITNLTEKQLDAELEKGFEDLHAKDSKSAGQVFSDIRQDYNL